MKHPEKRAIAGKATEKRHCRGCGKRLVRGSGRHDGIERPSELALRKYCGEECRRPSITDGPHRFTMRHHKTLWVTSYRSVRSGSFTVRTFGVASTEAKAREQLVLMRESWAELQADFTKEHTTG